MKNLLSGKSLPNQVGKVILAWGKRVGKVRKTGKRLPF